MVAGDLQHHEIHIFQIPDKAGRNRRNRNRRTELVSHSGRQRGQRVDKYAHLDGYQSRRHLQRTQ